MNLYEIDFAILNCLADVDEETGEILDVEKLEALEIEKAKKQESIALWIKNLKAEKDAVKKEKMEFADRQKKIENKISSLENYLQDSLQGEKFSTPKVKVSYRSTQAVNVLDVYALEEEYLKVAEPVADKTAIKEAIKNGVIVEGAELITNTSMIIK